MAQSKKFGTFGGVFTPSILTILGVIMYMRLPWIVGQAGFFLTAGIIIVAHLVSVSTGLSVSSIATDKKVKAGGTYYIISRSLGLPIGGTLGIALFFGLSMSVSLYLIGFSESLLGFWGYNIDKDAIRLTGTIALIFVATLTFISTSLAIKTQYFIMTAIGLSLLTIIFGSRQFVPVEPLLSPIPEIPPLILLFAIFFPAVTGFEAGVSMSGDLQDPKKSIPVGTISAITVGLIVYLGLAFFFAYRVNAEQLINNPNILLDISFFPPLLVAGIWGATLSSAIGSILGAPRILQATSLDRITPGIFAKGYGNSNEPRNALFLTFIIAEAGILVGELNLIARVVSMFFITTYGFLNLSSSLEKWASTDFRPSFKIPGLVSIIGAVVCFILMLELDFIALIGATLIMGTIFFFLKKKELTLESGDTWEGVWASILRSGLNRLNRTVKQARNWRPNIILFSGSTSARPYLLELGRWLVYKRGILSNFNLIENKETPVIARIPATEDPGLKEKFQGIFARTMEVNEIYDGMETITKLYGFAGIEPNSVMLGWARRSKKPERFARMLRSLSLQDYNVLVVDYDQERGYGENRVIDLWWRGGSNNIAFALTLVKFLLGSETWEEAEARILLVNDDSTLTNRIYRNVHRILEDHRVKATIKIINNAIDRKPIHDIIKIESADTDLVIMGLPEITEESAKRYIESTDNLIDTLGSVLLIRASSFFKPVFIGTETPAPLSQDPSREETVVPEINHIHPLTLPENENAADVIINLDKNLENILNLYEQDTLSPFLAVLTSLLDNFLSLLNKNHEEFNEALALKEIMRCKKVLARIQSSYLFNGGRLIDEYTTVGLPEQKENLRAGLTSVSQAVKQIGSNLPSELIIKLAENHTNHKSIWHKFGHIIKNGFKKSGKQYKVRLHLLLESMQLDIDQFVFYKHLQDLTLTSYRLFADIQKLFTATTDTLLLLEKKLDEDKFDNKLVEMENQLLVEKWQSINESLKTADHELRLNLQQNRRIVLQQISNILQRVNINKEIRGRIQESKKSNSDTMSFTDIPESWHEKQRLVCNFFEKEILIKKFQNRIETILERFFNDIQLSIHNNFIDKLDDLAKDLETLNAEPRIISMPVINQDPQIYRNLFQNLLHDVHDATEDLPEDLEIMAEESYQKLETEPFAEVSTLLINLRRYMEYLVETDMFDPLQNRITDLMQSLPKAIDVAHEVVRFTNHNLSQPAEADSIDKDSLTVVIQSGLQRIINEKTILIENHKDLYENFQNIVTKTFDKMNPYLVARAAGELKKTIRSKEGKKILYGLAGITQKINTWSKNLIVRLIYQKSESVLLAKKIGKISAGYQTRTGHVVETLRKLSPDSEIYGKLPLYYSQLFVDKRMISKEFLVDRKKEIMWAAKTIETYRKGYKGALLLIGERFSGKSTLSQTIAAKYFDRQKVFHVFAPAGGSIDLKAFENRLAGALQRDGKPNVMISTLPQRSVVIFHDLELWWERSKDGLQLIDKIIDLIYLLSDHCFFIVNSNSHSFRFINKIRSIEDTFINAIECQPFDSEEIQEAILLRHRSTGLKFELAGQREENISNLQLARLFNKYFDVSGGNIGQAMHYWISNIKKVEPKLLKIQLPVNLNDFTLNNLNMEWLIILQQFELHGQLSRARLGRILGSDLNAADQAILYLKRSGLIQEIQNDILVINPYSQSIVHRRLVEMGML